MDIHEKMHNGMLYNDQGAPDLLAEQRACLEKLYDFNATRPSEQEKRRQLLCEMFAELGEGCYIEPPLHANWGGRHVHFGRNVYANFSLTLVDDTHIYVGDNTLIGPNVTIATAGHPVDPELRAIPIQFNMPVH
ncbi:MAG: maltose acetyltransferase domain-containing protein, partial [Clostridia bacterium]|nr:maltose acetyltransferase domain-containing protein [Clostridia bacterium]